MGENEYNTYIANENDYTETILARSHSIPVLLYFWAEGCPPCRIIGPVLKNFMKKEWEHVALAKVEVDENMHLCGRYKIAGFPTVILFINGEEKERFSGARQEHYLREMLARQGVTLSNRQTE